MFTFRNFIAVKIDFVGNKAKGKTKPTKFSEKQTFLTP